MSKPESPTRSIRPLRVGLAAGAAIITTLAVTASPAFAEPRLTLSASSGPTAGGNTLTAQAPAGVTPFLASTPPQVQFQAITTAVTACRNTFTAATAATGSGTNLTAGVITATDVYRISSSRIAVTVPAGVIIPTGYTAASARYNMCVYDTTNTTTSTLLASAPYTVAAKPLITNISPVAGPALGGYTISVAGSGFTAGTTATLGNVPLSNVTVNTTGTLLTGTAPARSAGTNVPLVLNSLGGTVSSADPDQDPVTNNPSNFTLTNGIIVTPNTAPGGTTPTIDIQGVGFSSLSFADSDYTTAIAAAPHIALIAKSTGYGLAAAAARPIALCYDAVVLSDTELLCTLDLNTTLDPAADTATTTGADVPDGAYNVQIIQTNAAAATAVQAAPTAITSGSTFTVSAY